MPKLPNFELPTKSIPISHHGSCPFGHPWIYVARKIGFCAEEECQVAWVIIGSRNKKVYFELEGLQALLEGEITPEEITEREKLRDGDSRY